MSVIRILLGSVLVAALILIVYVIANAIIRSIIEHSSNDIGTGSESVQVDFLIVSNKELLLFDAITTIQSIPLVPGNSVFVHRGGEQAHSDGMYMVTSNDVHHGRVDLVRVDGVTIGVKYQIQKGTFQDLLYVCKPPNTDSKALADGTQTFWDTFIVTMGKNSVLRSNNELVRVVVANNRDHSTNEDIIDPVATMALTCTFTARVVTVMLVNCAGSVEITVNSIVQPPPPHPHRTVAIETDKYRTTGYNTDSSDDIFVMDDCPKKEKKTCSSKKPPSGEEDTYNTRFFTFNTIESKFY
jgi:hypothetical protein